MLKFGQEMEKRLLGQDGNEESKWTEILHPSCLYIASVSEQVLVQNHQYDIVFYLQLIKFMKIKLIFIA